MRLNRKYLRTVFVKPKITLDDGEGGIYEDYKDKGIAIEANIQPATSRLQGEVYGERISNILNMLCTDHIESLAEGVALCVYTSEYDKPDYKIISIKRWSTHIQAELEKI